jgi:hypothetical protein
VTPVANAETNVAERDHGRRPVNRVSRTMIDGFVPGASVKAVTSDTPANVNQYDTGSVPDDPGELGIDALLGPSTPPDSGEQTDTTAETGADGSPADAEGVAVSAAAGEPVPGAVVSQPVPGSTVSQPVPGSTVAPAPASTADPVPASTVAPLSPLGDQEAAPPRDRLRDLARDSRMRIWRRRILITVIAGGVFSIIFTWRLGLTVAVLVAIADTIYRSRTMASVPPGVKVTHAQRRTQRQLARMERAGYLSLHSRPIPGSKEFIDHLVVGPTGVYAIDSEKWDRRLPIRTRNARQLWHGPESKKDRLEHAKWEAERASTLLSGNLGKEITVRPTMAVYGPKVPWDIATIRDVDVYSGPRVRKYLRKQKRGSGEQLNADEIEKIHRAAMTVLPL